MNLYESFMEEAPPAPDSLCVQEYSDERDA